MNASPRPWTTRRHAAGTGHFLRIYDATGNRVADFYPHESVGGRGIEQAQADARLVIALANSPAADDIDARTVEVEIPAAEQPPMPTEARLL